MYKKNVFNLKRSSISQIAPAKVQSPSPQAPASQQPVNQAPDQLADQNVSGTVNLYTGKPGEGIPLLKDDISGPDLKKLLLMSISTEQILNVVNESMKRQGFNPAMANEYTDQQLTAMADQVGADLMSTFKSYSNFASDEFKNFVSNLK